jgi:hypothetical protein
MIRTILLTTALLATAGFAQAQEIKVSLHGKSTTEIRAELDKAAKLACSDAPVQEYTTCVDETYRNALNSAGKLVLIK